MIDRSSLTRIKATLLHPWQLARRIPFTLFMLLILLVVAWYTNSYFQVLTRAWMSRLGFAPRDFWLFRWERLFLSAMVTSGGFTFWLALVMVAVTSGVAEWMTGSLRAVVAFWGVHLVTLVMEALIFSLPLRQLGFTLARGLFFSRDVGPSAGYMGSLGYIVAFLPKPWRWIVFSLILVYLVAAFFLPESGGLSPAINLSDDLAHFLAFPLGWVAAAIIARKRVV